MIEVDGLTKYYGRIAAIQDVSFRVEQGEIVGFLGPNGAGKSTTMRIVAGFMAPTSGRASIAEFDVQKAPIEAKRRLGYLPENVPLYPEMLVRSFLNFCAEVKGLDRAARRTECGRVMERVGLTDMAKRPIGNLSKGYRQRVGLAQALIGNPPVLILDEPTVGLDPRQIIEIRSVIRGLAEEHTVLLSTHILPEVQMICERVVIIHQGRLVAQDRMENLAGGIGRGLTVSCSGAPDAVTKALDALDGVASVTRTGEGRYRVEAPATPAMRAAVAKALLAQGIELHELSEERRTLEDIFVAAIATEESGAA